MKYLNKLLLGSLVLTFALLLAACNAGGGGVTPGAVAGEGGVVADTAPVVDELANPSGTLLVGGWPAAEEAFSSVEHLFLAEFPDVEIEYLMMSHADFRTMFMTSLAAGTGAPDVAMLEGGWIGQVRESPAMENLLLAPYNAGRLQTYFPEYRWDLAHSVDRSRLAGIPWDIGPVSLYYRWDIFQEVGLPYQPEEVYELMRTWEGVLQVAEAVSIPGERFFIANAGYMFRWNFVNRDYFNDRLELQLHRPGVVDALNAAIAVNENGWDAQTPTAGVPEAQALLNSGGIVAHVSGAWYGGVLKTNASPDNAGNWMITRIPAGIPDSNWGGSFLGIPSQSDNKSLAWAFIEFLMTSAEAQNIMFDAVDYFPAFIPAWDDPMYSEPDPWFNNQLTRELWVDIARNTPAVYTTMMDLTAEQQMIPAFNAAVGQGMNAYEILDFVYDTIMEVLREDRETNIDVLRDAGLWHE